MDVTSGAQPLRDPDTGAVLAVNGEIYNHKSLRNGEAADFPYQTGSDCEVILALYRKHGAGCVAFLHGMFGFVLYEPATGAWLIGRDPIGILPLYFGPDARGRLLVASEMKALAEVCVDVQEFPAGHTWSSADAAPVRYFERDWMQWDTLPKAPATPADVREALTAAVRSHLMSDVPYGLLISGGLDSSVVAAIAMQFARNRVEDDGATEAWWPRVHSFSIGLAGSPDVAAAEKVAAHIGTVHHSLTFTIQEGIDALEDVIRHVETYDVTTIRAFAFTSKTTHF